MDIPEDCEFAYIVNHEAWYAEATNDVRHPSVMVQAAAFEGGVAWEFKVDEHNFGRQTAIQVCVFDDAFVAYRQVPEFFAALVEEKPDSLAGLRKILDRLGAKDRTARANPYS